MKTGLLLLMRLTLAGVYVVAGALKLRDTHAFATEIANYHLFPDLARPIALTLPAIEIVIGLALLMPRRSQWFHAAALLATAVMAVFIVAVGQVIARGINVDCGCFGGSSGPVTWLTLARDIALLGFAVVTWNSRSQEATRPAV